MRRLRERRGTNAPSADHQRLYEARTIGKASKSHRFVGVDGEGWTDENGRHHYMALVIGDQALYRGRPLSTRECLDFMLGFPESKGTFHVGFFFDYDVTMILRDILDEAPEIMAEIVNPSGDNYRKLVRWGKYMISYIPKKRFTVRLYGDNARKFVVHDTRAFFQMSFVKALKTYGVTGQTFDQTDHRAPVVQVEYPDGTWSAEYPENEAELVELMKTQRAGFTLDRAREIIDYCRMECRLLTDLMGEVRDRFADAKLDASPYEGPGPVAGKVLKAHGFKDSEDLLPPDVRAFTRKAYYGGRFEISAHGTIPVPVYEYDIKSAYPWAMTQLPCLKHGVWRWETTKRHAGQINGLWCGRVSWNVQDTSSDHPGGFGPLPFRTPDGRINFPAAGNGWYWSVEIPPYAWVCDRILRYHNTCNCDPFGWVERMFADRIAMENERPGSGIALKLVLNSLYGKLAQRVGARPHFNSVWSGLITALTRARVRSIHDAGHEVVMFATDAVFTLNEIDDFPMPDRLYNRGVGHGLGAWEHAGTYDHLTIFQPGVYFDQEAAKFKTRGVPMREIQERASEFIAAANSPDGKVKMAMTNHLGLRQCLAWGPKRYKDLGDWLDAPRTMRVDPTQKRRLKDQWWDGGTRGDHRFRGDWYVERYVGDRPMQRTMMIPGHPENTSTPYEQDPETEMDLATNMWEEGLCDADDGPWHDNNVTTKPNTPDERPGHNNAMA